MNDQLDRELLQWSDDFRGAAAEEPAISFETVLLEARRDVARARREWTLNILGNAFALIMLLGVVAYTRSILHAVFAAVAIPVLVALFGWFVHLRQSIGTNQDEGIESHVRLTLRRKTADVRMLRASRYALGFLIIAFWSWLPFAVLAKSEKFMAEPWRLAVAVAFALGTFGLSWWRALQLMKRAEREKAHWTKVLASFDHAEG